MEIVLMAIAAILMFVAIKKGFKLLKVIMTVAIVGLVIYYFGIIGGLATIALMVAIRIGLKILKFAMIAVLAVVLLNYFGLFAMLGITLPF